MLNLTFSAFDNQSPIAERFTCQGGEIYELVGTYEKK